MLPPPGDLQELSPPTLAGLDVPPQGSYSTPESIQVALPASVMKLLRGQGEGERLGYIGCGSGRGDVKNIQILRQI